MVIHLFGARGIMVAAAILATAIPLRSTSVWAKGAAVAANSPFTDHRQQSPGRGHLIRAKDLPPPHATPSVDSGRRRIPRPRDAWPQAPAGFVVQLFAEGLQNPRLIRRAPNGDIFVAESREGFLRVFRGVGADGRARQSEKFAEGLRQPFGMAFHPPGPDPQWLSSPTPMRWSASPIATAI